MNDIGNKDNILCLEPLKQYAPPAYPTNMDAASNPALLKKLPSRWQKKAGIAAACAGLAGTVVLSGCPFIHFGGSGGAPYYVVHLTEQEALNIIRPRLEAVGLDFTSVPPESSYLVYMIGYGVIGLELLDEDKGVGVTVLAEKSPGGECYGGTYYSKEVEKAFSLLDPDLTVGVFYCPGEYYEGSTLTDSKSEEMKQSLEAHLSGQIDDFIELLQGKGILDP